MCECADITCRPIHMLKTPKIIDVKCLFYINVSQPKSRWDDELKINSFGKRD